MDKLQQYIDTLRTKPKHVRSRVSAIGAGVCTGIIALVWITTLPSSLNNSDQRAVADAESPSMWQQISGEFAGIANVFRATETESESDELMPAKNNTIDLNAIVETENRRDAAERTEQRKAQDNVILIGTSTRTGVE